MDRYYYYMDNLFSHIPQVRRDLRKSHQMNIPAKVRRLKI